MATYPQDVKDKLRQFGEKTRLQKICMFLRQFERAPRRLTEKEADVIIDTCIKRGFLFNLMSKHATTPDEMRDLWLKVLAQYWYDAPEEAMIFGLVKAQFEFMNIGFLTIHSETTKKLLIEIKTKQHKRESKNIEKKLRWCVD